MAEENKGQEPEQEPVQGEDPAQEPEDAPQEDKPDKEKGEGMLMPILYAALAGVGAFTLVLIVGIVVTILTRPPEDPSETPFPESSSQVTLTDSPTETETQGPDGEDAGDEIETQGPDGEDAGGEAETQGSDGEGDTPE